jgi:competence protein ComEC
MFCVCFDEPQHKTNTMSTFKYASENEAPVYESVIGNKGKKAINRILLGTYVSILDTDGDWYRVSTAGPDGWMHKDSLCDAMGMKVFFLDSGQGDAMLLEIGNYKILIDAGPDSSLHNYLTKWQYTYLLKEGEKVHIDYLIISHFDTDHYKGFVRILENPAFTFGTICHAGILKFAATGNPYDTGLGETVKSGSRRILTQVFDDLTAVKSTVPFNRDVSAFMDALQAACKEGRVSAAKRYEAGDTILQELIDGNDFRIDVLAPFTEKAGSKKGFVYWEDDGKTINGHSLVLKLTYGTRTLLLGGDLNTFSEEYLIGKYPGTNPFDVDVAKSCHHGSSDFTVEFMDKLNPCATVISSGDNESFAHPRADAIGCAGKYTKSKRPLVFSTELARSANMKTGELLFGMINMRCNGKDIYISQMKEAKNNADIWDSYEIM